MDDKRFDSLARALANATNRREFLLGLLGLGGAAVVGAELDAPAEAARRPTPTPKPVRCPGIQIPGPGGVCTCPGTLTKCGPDCCNETAVSPGNPAYSECCDNACCFGTCYGEELCCATNTRPGGLPPSQRICDTVDGRICCPVTNACCIIDGCCPTFCFGGSVGTDFCCSPEDSCPGDSESNDVCCVGDTTCCGAGTNGNACVDLVTDDNNCGSCGNVCSGCSTCQNGQCLPADEDCEGTEVCCPDGGGFTCETGPFCGCDNDGDCSRFTNPTTCKVGVCTAGTCGTAAAPNTTVCHPAGTSAICDPAVMCNGDDQSCPVVIYPPAGTDCGACMQCNRLGACLTNCTADQQCCQLAPPVGDVCIPNGETCCDSAEACGLDCEVCNDDLHYCISGCSSGTEKCCPGTDNCVPIAATCCEEGTDCSGLNTCDGLTWHQFTCGVDGYCVDSPVDCNDGRPCTTDTCDAATGCGHSEGCGSPGECETGPGTCNDSGQCVYPPLCSGDTPTCCSNDAGMDYCIESNLTCCKSDGGDCDGPCAVCGEGGYCVSECIGADTCCTEGGAEACCAPGQCSDGIGCCTADNVCGSQCCGAAESCCEDSFCVPGGPHCCIDGCSDTPPPCFTLPGFCDLSTGQCQYIPVDCNTPPTVCYARTGTCSGGNCSYTPLVYGVSCGACVICNGAGACIADPVCACQEVGGPCTIHPDCCGDGDLLCNEDGFCEIGCGFPGAPPNCLCSTSSMCTISQMPCCAPTSGGLARCALPQENCACFPQGNNSLECAQLHPDLANCCPGDSPSGLICGSSAC